MISSSSHGHDRAGRRPSLARLVALAVGLLVSLTLDSAHALQCEGDVVRREFRTLVLVEVAAGGVAAPDEAAKWAAMAELADTDQGVTDLVGEGTPLFDGEDLVLVVAP